MPFVTTWEDKGIYWNYHGIVTAQDISDSNNLFYSDSRSDSAKYQIADGTDVEEVISNIDDMQLLAIMDLGQSHSTKNLKIALVGTLPSLLNIYQSYIKYSAEFNNSWSVKIFKDINSARKWVRN